MPPKQEHAPIPDERLLAVSQWIQDNYRPALRVISEGHEQEQQEPQQEFEVRRYQLEAWANVWEARQEGQTRGLVHLATGLGKTSVAVFDVMKFREECLAQNPPIHPRILFVSHMNDISEQAQERFARFMPDLDMDFFKPKQKGVPDADLTFATFQSLHKNLDRFDPQDYEYIIYDEAHHSEAETFKEVREYFDPLFELALTATPDRLDQQDIREYFGEALYKKTLPEAIAEGWLADVDYHIVFDDIVKQLMEEGFEPKTLKEFHELFKVRPRNEVIAKNIREERHKIGLDAAKTIIFCEDVSHAEEMAELLGGVAYHSGIKKEDRKPILKDFRMGNNQVICTVDMFNEGIDIPDARLVVFLRSTSSGTIFEQQLGRGLRKTASKEKVSVLDFVANVERIQKVRELSRSIQQRAEELGDKDLTEEGVIHGGDQEEPGVRIHSQHGDFDFDRIAVDLLEKWGSLTPSRAPEGFLSINAFATEHGFTYGAIYNAIEELGIEARQYTFKGKLATFLSQGEQLQVYAVLADDTPLAPEEILSVNQFSREQGINYNLILRAARELGQSLRTYKFGPTPGKGLDPIQQKGILNHLASTLPLADSDCKTVIGFADEIGMSYMTVRRIMEAENLEPQAYRFESKRGSKIALGLTTSQQEKIRRSSVVEIPEAPEGYVSLNVYAAQAGISPKTVQKVVEQLEISMDTYRLPSGPSSLLSPEQQLLLSEQPVVKLRPPEGYLSVNGFATAHGIGNRRVKRVIEEIGLQLSNYFFHSHLVPGLSPDDQKRLRRELGL